MLIGYFFPHVNICKSTCATDDLVVCKQEETYFCCCKVHDMAISHFYSLQSSTEEQLILRESLMGES